jgi:leucyl/phenylalanyl-tRNA--protein transferase
MAQQEAAYYKLPSGYVLALDENTAFPPLDQALAEPNGLIAIGGDLSATRLLNAYKQGIFPWFSEGEPVMWWSPNPRMVLFPDELKVSNSLKKTLKHYLKNQNNAFETRMNTSFHAVITACRKTPRSKQNGTWISQDMIEAYCELHNLGYAICAESWLDNKLVGGCYGIKIGRMFYGESMFHHVTDASKVAFVHLVEHLKNQGIGMIDCQMKTPLLASFGGREIAREEFMQNLTKLINF